MRQGPPGFWRKLRRLAEGGVAEARLRTMLVLPLLALQAPASAGPSSRAPEQVFLGVTLLKTGAGPDIPWAVEPPRGCRGCRLVLDRFASGQNAREVYFHLWAPADRTRVGPIRVRIDPARVRGVLVGRTDYQLPSRGRAASAPRADGPTSLPFRREGDAIIFKAPSHPHGFDLPPDDLGDVTQRYTYIETPGVYIRIAHADPLRRAGRYAEGPWPAVQARAALNLEFAAREAIAALGLAAAARRYGATTIMLMNFDTNYPTLGPGQAHEDWPPHWHMHLYWNTRPKVRKVDHSTSRHQACSAATSPTTCSPVRRRSASRRGRSRGGRTRPSVQTTTSSTRNRSPRTAGSGLAAIPPPAYSARRPEATPRASS